MWNSELLQREIDDACGEDSEKVVTRHLDPLNVARGVTHDPIELTVVLVLSPLGAGRPVVPNPPRVSLEGVIELVQAVQLLGVRRDREEHP